MACKGKDLTKSSFDLAIVGIPEPTLLEMVVCKGQEAPTRDLKTSTFSWWVQRFIAAAKIDSVIEMDRDYQTFGPLIGMELKRQSTRLFPSRASLGTMIGMRGPERDRKYAENTRDLFTIIERVGRLRVTP